jgi:DNA-binding HxlR family transcriptional regulator
MKVSTSGGPSDDHLDSSPLSQQLQHGNLLAKDCPSREVLKHMTSRWGVLVLMVLDTKKLRFSELRRAIGGVSERMLAQTLQWLESDGLVERVAFDVVPPHVEYSLTPLGSEAAERVRSLADWIETNLPRILMVKKTGDRDGMGPAVL